MWQSSHHRCWCAQTSGGLMRSWFLAALAIMAVTVSAKEGPTSGSLERPFSANGSVKMDLVAGDYRISGAPQDREIFRGGFYRFKFHKNLGRTVLDSQRGADAPVLQTIKSDCRAGRGHEMICVARFETC